MYHFNSVDSVKNAEFSLDRFEFCCKEQIVYPYGGF